MSLFLKNPFKSTYEIQESFVLHIYAFPELGKHGILYCLNLFGSWVLESEWFESSYSKSIHLKKITWICQNSENKSMDSEGHLYSGFEISDLMTYEKSKN